MGFAVPSSPSMPTRKVARLCQSGWGILTPVLNDPSHGRRVRPPGAEAMPSATLPLPTEGLAFSPGVWFPPPDLARQGWGRSG